MSIYRPARMWSKPHISWYTTLNMETFPPHWTWWTLNTTGQLLIMLSMDVILVIHVIHVILVILTWNELEPTCRRLYTFSAPESLSIRRLTFDPTSGAKYQASHFFPGSLCSRYKPHTTPWSTIHHRSRSYVPQQSHKYRPEDPCIQQEHTSQSAKQYQQMYHRMNTQ